MRRWQSDVAAITPSERELNPLGMPIFQFYQGYEERFVRGFTRQLLTGDQVRSWDYFFRPDFNLIDEIDDGRLSALRTQLEPLTRELREIDVERRSFSGRLKEWLGIDHVARREALVRERKRIAQLEADNIRKYREGMRAALNLAPMTDVEMGERLKRLLNEMQQRAIDRYDLGGPDLAIFGPMTRWVVESGRENSLVERRPRANNVARRGSRFARYYVFWLFVDGRGILKLDTVLDVVLGEFFDEQANRMFWRGVTGIEDSTYVDYDLRSRLQKAIEIASAAPTPEEADEVELHDQSSSPSPNEAVIGVASRRRIRLTTGRDNMELEFVTSGVRETLESQLAQRIAAEQDALAQLQQDSDAVDGVDIHQARLARLEEDMRRVERQTVAPDVDEILNHIHRLAAGS